MQTALHRLLKYSQTRFQVLGLALSCGVRTDGGGSTGLTQRLKPPGRGGCPPRQNDELFLQRRHGAGCRRQGL